MLREEEQKSFIAFANAGSDEEFMQLLSALPQHKWSMLYPHDITLLHLACRKSNPKSVVLLLQTNMIDVNSTTADGWNPVREAIRARQPRILELLCAAKADLRQKIEGNDLSQIDVALFLNYDKPSTFSCAHVFVANGVRLSTVNPQYQCCITFSLYLLERSVLRCRKAVIAILRVKKAGQLCHWDKFLLREIGFAIWATRWDENW